MTDPVPNWDAFPCLDDVITKADVDTKGGGKFAADYVNHMKVAQLLRKHAAGWQFELRTTTDDQSRETHVFRAPDGTGYVVGFFRAPTGSGFLDTPDMPQAIMDNRNGAIQWDKIGARDVTDTERRCMCTAAARHFGLAWQLWAKVDIENPHRGDDGNDSTPSGSKPKPKPNPPAQQQSIAKPKADPLQARRDKCKAELGEFYKAGDSDIVDTWRLALKLQFNEQIKADAPTVANLTTDEQVTWCESWITDYKAQIKK